MILIEMCLHSSFSLAFHPAPCTFSRTPQFYTFRTERQTKSTCSISVQKGYTLGATLNLEFALPTPENTPANPEVSLCLSVCVPEVNLCLSVCLSVCLSIEFPLPTPDNTPANPEVGLCLPVCLSLIIYISYHIVKGNSFNASNLLHTYASADFR